MTPKPDPAREVQLLLYARIIAPQAYKRADAGKASPADGHAIQSAMEKAHAIAAAQDLQLSFGRHTAKPDWPPSEEARRTLIEAAEATGQAIYAATQLAAEGRSDRMAKALGRIGERMVDRDARQASVATWCAAAFGSEHAASLAQRGVRFLEEAVELFQRATLDGGMEPTKARLMAHQLVDYVMDRPAGDLGQEFGGVGVTILALAAAAKLSAEDEEAREVARVMAKPLEHFHARNQAKNAAGFDVTGGAYPMADGELLFYVDEFTDEAIPCEPTLEAWAAWMAKPDPDWPSRGDIADGAEFAVSTLIVLGDIRAEWTADGWKSATRIPAGTEQFFLRHHEGSLGWNAEFAGDEIDQALSGMAEDDSPAWMACVANGPDVRVRFDAAEPRLVFVGNLPTGGADA